jgi:hypothetical protein
MNNLYDINFQYNIEFYYDVIYDLCIMKIEKIEEVFHVR